MAGTITPITMPKFGLAMTEGKIASWNVEPGSSVDVGEELADIETTKITNGYESPAAGILRRQVASEGETLAVGALIGVLADKDVSDADIDAFVEKFQNEFSSQAAETGASESAEPVVVEVGDLKLKVQDSGHGDDTPVLFIHGFGGDLTNWMFNQDHFSGSRRTVAFDLPGHGGSSKNVGDGKPATFAATTAALLDKLDIVKAHVVAHSLGGAIALELAKWHPEKVASLSLVAPAGLGKDINMDFINGFISADRRKTLEPVLHYLVHDKSLITRNMIEGIIRFKRLDGAVAGLETVAKACFPDGHQADDLHGALENFTTPKQVIWGENDQGSILRIGKGLPASVKITLLPETGHMPQMEKSADVNAAVTQLIA